MTITLTVFATGAKHAFSDVSKWTVRDSGQLIIEQVSERSNKTTVFAPGAWLHLVSDTAV